MLGYVQIVTLYVFKNVIFSKLMPAKLRAVLDTFGFSENEFAPRSDSRLLRKFNIWALDSLEMEIFESVKKLFDSAQC